MIIIFYLCVFVLLAHVLNSRTIMSCRRPVDYMKSAVRKSRKPLVPILKPVKSGDGGQRIM
jgi:hypothetical protein